MDRQLYEKVCYKWKNKDDVDQCLKQGLSLEEINRGYYIETINLTDYIDCCLLERLMIRYPLKISVIKKIEYLENHNQEYINNFDLIKATRNHIKFDTEILRYLKRIDPVHFSLYMPIKCNNNESLKNVLFQYNDSFMQFNNIKMIRKEAINKQLEELAKLVSLKKEVITQGIYNTCDWYSPHLSQSELLQGIINEKIDMTYGIANVTLNQNCHLNEIIIKQTLGLNENPYNQMYCAVNCIESEVLPRLKKDLLGLEEEKEIEDYDLQMEKYY